jgi:RNA polymerase sigma-70 factor (ECF subfamily)
VDSEKKLLEQAAKGDSEAFSKLFLTYKTLVYRVVYRLLRIQEDVDDAVQQTFIEVFKSLPGYEGKSKFTTWLYRIAVNVSIQHLRKRRSDTISDFDPEILPSESKKDNLEQMELHKQIETALDAIPIKKRVVVVLHDIEERTMEEIAAILNIPLGTVKSRLFHGRDEMRKKLQKIMESV